MFRGQVSCYLPVAFLFLDVTFMGPVAEWSAALSTETSETRILFRGSASVKALTCLGMLACLPQLLGIKWRMEMAVALVCAL